MADLTNFSGSASDMTKLLAESGIKEEGAAEAFAAAGIHFESIMTRSDVAGQ